VAARRQAAPAPDPGRRSPRGGRTSRDSLLMCSSAFWLRFLLLGDSRKYFVCKSEAALGWFVCSLFSSAHSSSPSLPEHGEPVPSRRGLGGPRGLTGRRGTGSIFSSLFNTSACKHQPTRPKVLRGCAFKSLLFFQNSYAINRRNLESSCFFTCLFGGFFCLCLRNKSSRINYPSSSVPFMSIYLSVLYLQTISSSQGKDVRNTASTE